MTVSFKRDANGRLDLTHGNYPAKRQVVMKVKYEKEVRFSFGVKKSESGEGRKLPPFNYWQKNCDENRERQISIAGNLLYKTGHRITGK